MDCSTAREALSARMDGEREPVPAARVDEHLDQCSECRGWYAAAAELARGMRVASATRTPDRTAEILAGVGVDIPRSHASRLLRWACHDHPWRAALLLIGLVQLGLGLTQVIGGGAPDMSEDMAGHLFNESTAWNIAVGVGFVVAALRPGAADGLIPVLVVFTVVLAVFVITDSVSGQVTAARVLSHAVIAVGCVVTVVVHRRDGAVGPPPAIPAALKPPAGARSGRRRGHLRATERATDPAA